MMFIFSLPTETLVFFNYFFFISIVTPPQVLSTSLTNIHENLTLEEKRFMFGDMLEEVPKYELVRLQHTIQKSGETKRIHYLSYYDGEKTVSWRILQTPISENTIVSLARANGSGQITFTDYNISRIHHTVKFFKDEGNTAGISVQEGPQGNLEFTGHLGNHTVLKPVPETVYAKWKELYSTLDDSRRVHGGNNRYLAASDYHILIKRSSSDEATFKFVTNKTRSKRGMTTDEMKRSTGPLIVYPKLLLLVNYFSIDFSSASERLVNNLLVYLICYWNAVNMTFRQFFDPQIQLNIGRIIIGLSLEAAPYLQNSRKPGTNLFQGKQALGHLVDYLQRFNLSGYDIIISQTDQKLCWQRDCLTSDIQGIAFYSRACIYQADVSLLSAAMVSDGMNFNSVDGAAHEIGHLFGAGHDREDFVQCIDGYFVMSTVVPRRQVGLWSPCSLIQIQEHLKQSTRMCWSHRPLVNDSVEFPEVLPGHVIGVDDQCKSRGWAGACQRNVTTCRALWCQSSTLLASIEFGCHWAGTPLPGTSCGTRRHCAESSECLPMDSDVAEFKESNPDLTYLGNAVKRL